jgi:hypothetical protein
MLKKKMVSVPAGTVFGLYIFINDWDLLLKIKMPFAIKISPEQISGPSIKVTDERPLVDMTVAPFSLWNLKVFTRVEPKDLTLLVPLKEFIEGMRERGYDAHKWGYPKSWK